MIPFCRNEACFSVYRARRGSDHRSFGSCTNVLLYHTSMSEPFEGVLIVMF